ncbi:hypothetical protein NHX12_025870 [Muraenolepis orangiensis]|uniref:Uncharacterized protein n=1 Tax=Muraenolepis orangiensis TaxID=630683 RepID=A0A9Q0EFH3_9TELE|nr:hypothetical protein NHX12_025870 [Muraenolepis orangiensis]
MHALSGCDTVSYPCGKGKASAPKVLQGTTMHWLDTVLGEPDTTHSDLNDTGTEFFLALYGQKKAKSMNAHYQIYSRRKKPPELKKPPPTDVNVMLHIQRAHLQVMLWVKAADQGEPPAEPRDVATFGWEVAKGGAVMPAVSTQAVASVGRLQLQRFEGLQPKNLQLPCCKSQLH